MRAYETRFLSKLAEKLAIGDVQLGRQSTARVVDAKRDDTIP